MCNTHDAVATDGNGAVDDDDDEGGEDIAIYNSAHIFFLFPFAFYSFKSEIENEEVCI